MADNKALEQRFNTLVTGNSPDNRQKYAKQVKASGKKMIGMLCMYMPEEIIHAAGMHPWRVTGTWDSDFSKAAVYRDLDSCRYCTHSLEALLRGDVDFLDGITSSDWDDDRRRVYDVWTYLKKPAFQAIYTNPKNTSETTERYFAEEIHDMITSLEKFGGVKVTDEKLRNSIEVFNKTRQLLCQLYDLRKRPVSPVTGAEVLGIVTTAQIWDKEFFNKEMEALLPFIANRKSTHKESEPRLLVSSDLLDNPKFFEIIEGEGAQIVMDDMETGSRYFYTLVDQYAKDPVRAIARRYTWRPHDSTAFNWEEQIKQIITWAREYRCDGIVDLYEQFSPARQWRGPMLVRDLAMAKIPFVSISRGYDVSGVEQIKTRIDSFMEMLPTGLKV